MGVVYSLLAPEKVEVNEVVLVPPLFERDHKGRSRLAKSSYDFLFCKPNLRWLFNDYLPCGMKSLLHFSPPEDPRISLTARLAASTKVGDSRKRVQLGDNHYGVRFSTCLTLHSNIWHVRRHRSFHANRCSKAGSEGHGVKNLLWWLWQVRPM